MKKLLMVTSRVPWPLDKGDKLRAYYQLRDLSKEYELSLFCINDQSPNEEAITELKKFCKEVKVIQISKISIAFSLFKAFFGFIPFQAAYFYNSFVQAEFDTFVNKTQPQRIYCQLIRTALLIRNRKEKKVLDYMDVFSKGVERRIAKVAWFKRPLFKMEYKRLLAFEEEVFSWFDERIVITGQDRNLIPHKDNKKIHVIPNGVDMNFFKPLPSKKEFDILFNGNMSYPPNVEAVLFLCNKILPIVKAKFPEIKILISGTNPSAEVLALQSSNVVVSGWVQDIRTNFSRSKVLVAPMQSSIGLQNKLLEGMAMEIPCVTSSLANNALKAKPGSEVLVANEPNEYAEAVELLLKDENRYRDIVTGAKTFLQQNYSWQSANKQLAEIIG